MKNWLVTLLLSIGIASCTNPGEDNNAVPDGGNDPDADVASTKKKPEFDCAEPPTLPATIESDLSVGPGCVIVDRTAVVAGAKLTIQPGTTVRMQDAGYLEVGTLGDEGILVAVGTEDKPIVFTSASDSPMPGDWQCVRIWSDSGSRLRFARFDYGGQPCEATGAYFEAMLDIDAEVTEVSDVTLTDSSTHGVIINSNSAVHAFDNNTFARNARASILVSASRLLDLGSGLFFEDADDYIEVDTTFALESVGTWKRQPVPFQVPPGLSIYNGADVTIEAGARIAMTGGSIEVFDAALKTAGTETDPVVFTSAQATPAAGDWGCVYADGASVAPSFQYTVFEYAGSGEDCTGGNDEVSLIAPAAAQINHCTFKDIAGSGVSEIYEDCPADWCDNTFESVTGSDLLCAGAEKSCS